jgi:carbonic anhydrase
MPAKALVLVIAASLGGVASTGLAADAPGAGANAPAAVFCATQNNRSCQQSVSPAQVLERFKAGNQRFISGVSVNRNYMTQVAETAAGQYPLASIVSCIDSRAPAEIVFDQGIGDVFNARIAGNIVNDDILGSLEFASKVAGSRLVVVLGHSGCGAVKGACDNVELGHLTGLLARIQPAVKSVQTPVGAVRTSANPAFIEEVAAANVRQTVQAIRDRSPILREMEQKGEISIVGAMYDVATGKVSWYE